MKTRIRKVHNPHADEHFVIDEVVTKQGHYITWSGIYELRKNAEKAVQTEQKIRDMKKQKVWQHNADILDDKPVRVITKNGVCVLIAFGDDKTLPDLICGFLNRGD